MALDDLKTPPDHLRGVRSYNDEMTISRVILFFERQGVTFTKPMIQGYVRMGVLPPLKDKRFYTREHLVLLAIVEHLKKGFTAEEIKRLFGAIAGETAEDAEAMLALYDSYMENVGAMAEVLARAAKTLPNKDGKFLGAAAAMAASVLLRETAEGILSE